MTGGELAGIIKGYCPDIPIICATSNPDQIKVYEEKYFDLIEGKNNIPLLVELATSLVRPCP